jgi:hypothetical protein
MVEFGTKVHLVSEGNYEHSVTFPLLEVKLHFVSYILQQVTQAVKEPKILRFN